MNKITIIIIDNMHKNIYITRLLKIRHKMIIINKV